MATFVLIHGSSSDARYWSRVVPLLEAAGHGVVAPDLPTTDVTADFGTYARAVVDAVGPGRDEIVVVGHSMGAFTAPVAAGKLGAALIVLTAPMIPLPGETPGGWFEHVGSSDAQAAYALAEGFDPAFDLMRTFFHDVPDEVVAEVMAGEEPPQAAEIFGQPCPIRAWPAIPTRVLACARDRMFPLDLVRRISRDRLGVEPDVLDSGHLPGFSRPDELAARLLGYLDTGPSPGG